jgi:hypothetical protein
MLAASASHIINQNFSAQANHCTGYAQRDKITKALRSRSEAIRTALEAYNKAAISLSPPREQLNFPQIINMVSLAEFDLLRDGLTDIRTLPWTQEGPREAMRLHFGLKRAHEEIERLNVEIRRQITYMFDEDYVYASVARSTLSQTYPALAKYIAEEKHYQDAIFSDVAGHLWQTSQLPGFSGTLSPGTREHSARSLDLNAPQPIWSAYLRGRVPHKEDLATEATVPDLIEEEENIMVDYFKNLSTVDR